MYMPWYMELKAGNRRPLATDSTRPTMTERSALTAGDRQTATAIVSPSPKLARTRSCRDGSSKGTRLDFSFTFDDDSPPYKRLKSCSSEVSGDQARVERSEVPIEPQSLTDLPLDLLARCLSALGVGHHRFVACCRALREAQLEAFHGKDSFVYEVTIEEEDYEDPRTGKIFTKDNEVPKKVSPALVTFGSSIQQSMSLLEIWEEETTPEYKEDREVAIKSEMNQPGPDDQVVYKLLTKIGALGCSAAGCGNLSVLRYLLQTYPDACALEREGENGSGGIPFRFHHVGGRGKGASHPGTKVSERRNACL